MKHFVRGLSLLLVVALAACGQTPPPADTGPDTVPATVVSPTGAPPFLGAALLLIDGDAAVTTASVIEVETGLFTGTIAPVAADGSVELILPEAAEMPASVLAPAGEFFIDFDYAVCELTTSVPDALVSEMTFGAVPMPLPGVVLMSVSGAGIAIATPEPMDLEDPALTIERAVMWLYADAAVSIATPAAGCDLDGLPMHVDLALEEGWNQVELTIETDPVTDTQTSASITNSDHEEIFLNAALF